MRNTVTGRTTTDNNTLRSVGFCGGFLNTITSAGPASRGGLRVQFTSTELARVNQHGKSIHRSVPHTYALAVLDEHDVESQAAAFFTGIFRYIRLRTNTARAPNLHNTNILTAGDPTTKSLEGDKIKTALTHLYVHIIAVILNGLAPLLKRINQFRYSLD